MEAGDPPDRPKLRGVVDAEGELCALLWLLPAPPLAAAAALTVAFTCAKASWILCCIFSAISAEALLTGVPAKGLSMLPWPVGVDAAAALAAVELWVGLKPPNCCELGLTRSFSGLPLTAPAPDGDASAAATPVGRICCEGEPMKLDKDPPPPEMLLQGQSPSQ